MPDPAVERAAARSAAAGSTGAPGQAAVASPAIAYWMFNYEPRWEAVSMELEALAAAFRSPYGTRTITLDTRRRSIAFAGADRHLPAALGVAALPYLLRLARGTSLNHIFASPAERVLTRRLARLPNTVLTIAKGSRTLSSVHRNAATLRRLQCLVVESERHRELLLQLDVPAGRIRLIHPGIEPRPYREPTGPFTLLFATSPKSPDYLLTRGVHLLLKTAALLPDVRFRLVWRWNPGFVERLVRDREVRNVEVLTGYRRDMAALYDEAHAVVLPALEPDSFKPCPHSALQSLAHGKPLLVSRYVSIADAVARHRCGVVFEPRIDAMRNAIRRLAARYDDYQANTAPTLAREFSKAGFLDRYGQLYAALLAERPATGSRDGGRPA